MSAVLREAKVFSQTRPLLAALMLLVGCAASSSASDGSGAAAPPGSSSGDTGADGGAAPKTCPPETDFDSDPDNCGRCGRACDDGACSRGICNPRVELELPKEACVVDLAVHGGELYAALKDELVTLRDGKKETVMKWPHAWSSDGRSLASDGENLWAVLQGEGDVEAPSDERLIRFAHFDAKGQRRGDLVSSKLPITTSYVAAGAGRLAHVDTVGAQLTLVDEAGAVKTAQFSGGPTPTGIRFFEDRFHVGLEVEIIRASKTGPLSKVEGAEFDRYAPWTPTPDGIVGLQVSGGEDVTLIRYPLAGGDRQELAKITVAEAQKLLSLVEPDVQAVDARFTIDWRDSEDIVYVDGAFYFPLRIPHDGTKNYPKWSFAILRFTEKDGFSLFAPVDTGAVTSRALLLRVGNGRLTWREGRGCAFDNYGERNLVRSAPL